ncbi:MAG: hypothetical protein ACLSDQ_07075 [Adlercreutzia equolifaciens]
MAEDGTTSLSSVLEELAVEVCAEAVSARRCVNEEHFDFVWVSCCEGAEPINLAAACKRDSPQTAVYLVTADRTGSVASRAQAAELDGIVSPAELGEYLLKEAARNIDGDRGDGESVALALPDSEGVRQALTTAKTQEENRAGFLLTVVGGAAVRARARWRPSRPFSGSAWPAYGAARCRSAVWGSRGLDGRQLCRCRLKKS